MGTRGESFDLLRGCWTSPVGMFFSVGDFDLGGVWNCFLDQFIGLPREGLLSKLRGSSPRSNFCRDGTFGGNAQDLLVSEVKEFCLDCLVPSCVESIATSCDVDIFFSIAFITSSASIVSSTTISSKEHIRFFGGSGGGRRLGLKSSILVEP